MKPECKLKLTPPILVSNMTDEEKEAYVEAVMALANANKDALSSMNNGLPTNSMDSLEQAASTLSDITASSAGDGEKAKTMDSETRKLAVEIIQARWISDTKWMTNHFFHVLIPEIVGRLQRNHDRSGTCVRP